MTYQVSPSDSRYIPLTQQDWCCVPTSIQMIMYRNNIPLIPAEELGYHLGLTVPPDQSNLFYNVRVSETPPSTAGFGTQIDLPEYNPNNAFKTLGIPLTFDMKLSSTFSNAEDLLNDLKMIEERDGDALLCFNHGVIRGEYQSNSGHVVVFDKVIDGNIRIVDASWKHPKWRLVEPSLLFDAIKQHGDENSGGIWYFEKAGEN